MMSEEKLTLREKLYWKTFWALRAVHFTWLDLTTPKPNEGEFCGSYLDRVTGGHAGPHGTVVGIDVVAKEAVWRGGKWTRQEGDFKAYYDANPHKTRPITVESPPKPVENETRQAYLERMQTAGFGGYFGNHVPSEAIWVNGEWT